MLSDGRSLDEAEVPGRRRMRCAWRRGDGVRMDGSEERTYAIGTYANRVCCASMGQRLSATHCVRLARITHRSQGQKIASNDRPLPAPLEGISWSMRMASSSGRRRIAGAPEGFALLSVGRSR